MKDPNSNLTLVLSTLLMDAKTSDDVISLSMIHKSILDMKVTLEHSIYIDHITSKSMDELMKYVRDVEYYVKTKIKLILQIERCKKESTVSTKSKSKGEK